MRQVVLFLLALLLMGCDKPLADADRLRQKQEIGSLVAQVRELEVRANEQDKTLRSLELKCATLEAQQEKARKADFDKRYPEQ